MSVFRFELAYNGAAYHGWQIQPTDATVQGEVVKALSELAQQPMRVGGSSRTDAGVHAMGQVVSFHWPETRRPLSPYVLHRALNGLLPRDMSVLRLEQVDALDHKGKPFHARHCARGKRYRYTIWANRIGHFQLAPVSWHIRRAPTDAGWARAAEAALDLVGEHDFTGFRAADCDAPTTVRAMHRVEIFPPANAAQPIEIIVEGSAFLKNMVRIIAGTLLDVARGALEPSIVQQVLDSKDRRMAGQTAPAHGLTLEEVFYPDFPWTQERWTLPEPT